MLAMKPASMSTASEPTDLEAGSLSASDTETADMAAMMGFSSFGAKPNPPSKKRKLEQSAASRTGAESGSGSNSMPLGTPRGQKAAGGVSAGLDNQLEEGNHEHIEPLAAPREGNAREHEEGRGIIGETGAREQALSGILKHHAGPAAGINQPQYDWNVLRRGVKNDRGDVAYYDASFIEDPWKHLTT